MAARRLLIVVLVMLGISTLAAALVPPQARRDLSDTTQSSPETTPSETAPRKPPGRLLRQTIDTNGETIVRLHVADQLQLAVRSDRRDQVELPDFGLIETVAPGEPALFDVLVQEPGSYPIRLVDANRVVGRLEVSRGKRG